MAKGDKFTTPSHITTLLQPLPEQGTDRRAWSIPLKGVWLPFFLATNTAGETAVSPEALGASLRLMREKDGTPKFGSNGRPAIPVVWELSDHIRIVRENFAQGLVNYSRIVRERMGQEFQAQVNAAQKAGEAIISRDTYDLEAYLKAKAKAEAQAQAEPVKELVAVS